MSERFSVLFKNQLSELERLEGAIEAFAQKASLDTKTVFEVNLALDELLTNVISYAYKDDKEHEIQLVLEKESGRLILTLEDDGLPFNPMDIPEPDTSVPIEEREIGGLGIHFVRKFMDSFDYRRESDRNIVTLVKSVEGCR